MILLQVVVLTIDFQVLLDMLLQQSYAPHPALV